MGSGWSGWSPTASIDAFAVELLAVLGRAADAAEVDSWRPPDQPQLRPPITGLPVRRTAYRLRMDPFTIGGTIAGAAARALVTKAVQGVAQSVLRRAWGESDELGRLFHLMEAALADELPAITHAELQRTWRTTPAFVEAYASASAGNPDVDDALVDAIEPLVGPAGEKSSRDLAIELVQALRLLLPEAKDETRRVLYEMRQFENRFNAQFVETHERMGRIEGVISRRSEPLLILSSDWPSAAEDALKRASAADSAGLRQLHEALDGKDRARELATLLNRGRAGRQSSPVRSGS